MRRSPSRASPHGICCYPACTWQAENLFLSVLPVLIPGPFLLRFTFRSVLSDRVRKKAYSTAGYPSGQAMKFSRFSEREYKNVS